MIPAGTQRSKSVLLQNAVTVDNIQPTNHKNIYCMTKQLKIIVGVLLVLLIAAGGFWYTKQNKPQPEQPTRTTQATGELTCETEGYACSLADMDQATYEKGTQLLDDIYSKTEAGQSLFEVREWVMDQDGVSTVKTDGRALVFRVDGSVPFIFEHPGIQPNAPDRKQIGTTSLKSDKNEHEGGEREWKFGIRTTHAQPVVSEETNVVGAQREEREEKRALVLSPYHWEFQPYDESPQVASTLGQMRWYNGRVTYEANNTPEDKNINLTDFLGWENYDTIHVATHGLSICPDPTNPVGCTSFLYTGLEIPKENFEANRDKYEPYKGMGVRFQPNRYVSKTTENGIVIEKSEGDIASYDVVVLPDFFRQNYGGGKLKNKILFFSACEILAQGDMLNALKSATENSDLFAWTRVVYSGDAQAAANQLYEDMAQNGMSAEDAYEKLPDNMKLGLPSKATDYEPQLYDLGDEMSEKAAEGIQDLKDTHKTTDLLHHKTGDKTNHIREVISQIHPVNGRLLEPGMVSYINGKANDGQAEKIDAEFEVEGYTQNELQQENITITMKVDDETVISGQTIYPDNPSDDIEVTQRDDRKFRVRINDIEIPDTHPDKPMKFRAELDLPAGNGISIHEVEPISVPRDVRAIMHEPLQADQTYNVTYDAETSVAHSYFADSGKTIDLYYEEKTGRSHFLAEGRHFVGNSSADVSLGAQTLTNTNVPPVPHAGIGFGQLPDIAAIAARLTIFAQVNEEMLEDAGYQKQSDKRYSYTDPQTGATVTFVFDDTERVTTWLLNSSEGNARVTYEYGDYTVTAPTGGEPMPTIPNIPGFGGSGSPSMPDMPNMPGMP